MKYQLPDPVSIEQQSRSEVPAVVVMPENGESLTDLAFRIACASILLSPCARRMALLDPRVLEAPITEEDALRLREWAEKGRVKIDYWKGRPIKLFISIKEDRLSISLNWWADRWETNETNTIPALAVTALGEVLSRVSVG